MFNCPQAWCIAVGLCLATVVNGQEKTRKPAVELRALGDLARYVGEYPCSNGILKASVMHHALQSALGRDYPAYVEHMSLSGCGPVQRDGEFLVMDVSQLHVGGYNSIIFLKPQTREIYVFWADGLIDKGPYRLYGSEPVPDEVSSSIIRRLNEGWGHVAGFGWFDGRVRATTATQNRSPVR